MEGQRCGKVRRFGRGQTRERLSGGFCFPANFVFLEGPVSGRMEFSPFRGRGRRRVEHVQVAGGSHPLLFPLLGITLLTSSAEERSSFLEKKGV